MSQNSKNEIFNFLEILRLCSRKSLGKKIALVSAGGGGSLGLLLSIPGASEFLHSIHLLYDRESTATFLEGYARMPEKFVSSEMSSALCDAMKARVGDREDVIVVGMTCAFTSNRERKGENLVYISESNRHWKMTLPKKDFSLLQGETSNDTSLNIANLRLTEDLTAAMLAFTFLFRDMNNEEHKKELFETFPGLSLI